MLADSTLSVLGLIVSVLALAVALLTAWLTLLKRATVVMTHPAVIFFGHDWSPHGNAPHLKVYLRTLLYATAKRGCAVQSLFAHLRRGDELQVLNVWVYGDDDLKRGSGLFVSQDGISTSIHFLVPFADHFRFQFAPGDYMLDIFASIIGERANRKLASIALSVTEIEAGFLKGINHGLYFDWNPEANRYESHMKTADPAVR